jgi:hypothetical protein
VESRYIYCFLKIIITPLFLVKWQIMIFLTYQMKRWNIIVYQLW